MPKHEHGETVDDLPRARLQTITLARPRCPACRGAALRKYRSIRDQGDGTSMAWVRCLKPGCGARFKIIME
jgi:hypothetical protein